MNDARSVVSEVEVPVDPATAFTVFTDEVDLWWVRGPINFWGDAGRVFGLHFEPGVVGRLLQVYDSPDGEEFELGRITVWDPGRAWDGRALADDVATEVRFEPAAGDTRVVVEAWIAPGDRTAAGRRGPGSCRGGFHAGSPSASGCRMSSGTSPAWLWPFTMRDRQRQRAGLPTCLASKPTHSRRATSR